MSAVMSWMRNVPSIVICVCSVGIGCRGETGVIWVRHSCGDCWRSIVDEFYLDKDDIDCSRASGPVKMTSPVTLFTSRNDEFKDTAAACRLS